MSIPVVTRIATAAPFRSDTVPSAEPRLGWAAQTDTPDWLQASAELTLDRASGAETHVVEGRASAQVEWPFAPLAPREEAFLKVRVTGTDGVVGEWSEPRRLFAGFLGEGEWVAAPIGLPDPAEEAQPSLLRTEFDVEGDVARATLYATAVGAYQVSIAGTDVDDQVLKPGWTPFRTRTIHETTDVTALLHPGRNALGVRLAGGWATERFGFYGNGRPQYGDQPRFAGQLLIEYADGRTQVVATDASWRAARGPIVDASIYRGETYDARRAAPGYDAPGFDDSAWSAVVVVDDIPIPEARTSPVVRRVQEFAVKDVIHTPAGKLVVDFGQNVVGRLRIRVSGPEGHTVTLRHAEVFENGEICTRTLRLADSTDRYTLAGGGVEEWEPEFTLHGFRYAELSDWPGEFDPADVTALVIHSDMERTGWFETSHPLVDRLHENIVWSMRGNFLYIPSDCPQRDERLGWTGDAEIFTPTATFLYDARGFLDSWLRDLAIEQGEDGVVPFVVPNVLGPSPATAGWGDAATIVPSVLNERFADVATLERQYPSMKAWVDAILKISGDTRLWEGKFQWGDWLDPDAPPQTPAKAKTDSDIVASAYLFRSVRFLVQAAESLGRVEDAAKYGPIAEEVRAAFLAEYVTPAGRMVSDAQTAYALAIMFDIAPEDQHAVLGARLAELSRRGAYRMGTGFAGTPIILEALVRTGRTEVARRLLTQTECPSWLYPVTMGATTVWERWDSMLPDGTVNPGDMTSFNHYGLGAIGDWLHRGLAGLAPAAPGYAELRIAPTPLAGFDHVAAEHLTPHGLAKSGWKRVGDRIEVEAVVPPNTTASVVLPDGATYEVGSGTHTWTVAAEEPPAPPATVGLSSSLAAIIDDPEAYSAVMEILHKENPDMAHRLLVGKWMEGRILGEALAGWTGADLQAQIADRLTEISASRASH